MNQENRVRKIVMAQAAARERDRRSAASLAKPTWWNRLLPMDKAICLGALVLLLSLVPHRSAPTGPAPLSTSEVASRDFLVQRFSMTRAAATDAVIATRLTSQQSREMEYRRRQRERDEESLQLAACRASPWLDRCQ